MDNSIDRSVYSEDDRPSFLDEILSGESFPQTAVEIPNCSMKGLGESIFACAVEGETSDYWVMSAVGEARDKSGKFQGWPHGYDARVVAINSDGELFCLGDCGFSDAKVAMSEPSAKIHRLLEILSAKSPDMYQMNACFPMWEIPRNLKYLIYAGIDLQSMRSSCWIGQNREFMYRFGPRRYIGTEPVAGRSFGSATTWYGEPRDHMHIISSPLDEFSFEVLMEAVHPSRHYLDRGEKLDFLRMEHDLFESPVYGGMTLWQRQILDACEVWDRLLQNPTQAISMARMVS